MVFVNKMKGVLLLNITTLNAFVSVLVCVFLIPILPGECRRALGGGHRKGSHSYTTRRPPSTSVTKSNFNLGSNANSHVEQAKLSYPNYNAPVSRPANAASQNSPQNIGWTNPNPNQGNHVGAPPAYSPNSMSGGAYSNVHDSHATYQKPNYAAPPPNYNQATGAHFGSGTNNLPPGTTYYSSNNIPPGANYYPSAAHIPGSGGYAGGGSVPQYYPSHNALPPGATFLPAGSPLPQGATYYASPAQQGSSGPGLGTGLIAGALGGAILGHVLTPTQTKVIEHAPTSTNDGHSNNDRIIIINNSGQPINVTDANNASVINPNNQAVNAPPDTSTSVVSTSSTLNSNMNSTMNSMASSDNNTSNNPSHLNEQPSPVPGGIICVPVRVNETDTNDSSKMIEVEKIACYPAPVPQPIAAAQTPDMNSTEPKTLPNSGMPPLAPLQNMPNTQSQVHTQPTLLAEQSPVRQASSKGIQFHDNIVFPSIIFLIAFNVMFSA